MSPSGSARLAAYWASREVEPEPQAAEALLLPTLDEAAERHVLAHEEHELHLVAECLVGECELSV